MINLSPSRKQGGHFQTHRSRHLVGEHAGEGGTFRIGGIGAFKGKTLVGDISQGFAVVVEPRVGAIDHGGTGLRIDPLEQKAVRLNDGCPHERAAAQHYHQTLNVEPVIILMIRKQPFRRQHGQIVRQ